MSLLDLLRTDPDQLKGKQVQQLIAFAGNGKLLDDGPCSAEFRTFLSSVPSANLKDYAEQCLNQSFPESGLALQDIVNEIGARLDAMVTHGRYRGTVKHLGLDGLWVFPNGHSIVIEVKTTDAYRIDLNTIASYRQGLMQDHALKEDASSMLLVVGRQDTGDLEAQIRGSRHAWDIRVVSVDALLRILAVKEEMEDPTIIQKIHSVLVPREFTRLDEIVDILFKAAEDIKDKDDGDTTAHDDKKRKEPKFTPVAFHEACVTRIQSYLGTTLIKRTRAQFSSPDKTTVVNCSVSKEHDPDTAPGYWFALHPHQRNALTQAAKAYVAFGCGTGSRVLLIPFSEFDKWLDGMATTESDDRFYWHVVVWRRDGKYTLHRRKGEKVIDLTQYLLPV